MSEAGMTTHHQHFAVPFDYPVVFTRDLFRPAQPLFVDVLNRRGGHRVHRALFFVDEGVAHHHPRLIERIHAYAAAHPSALTLAMEPRVVPGGERIKNDYRLTMEIVDRILECRLCRQSYVVAVGGGAVLDAVGFATAIVHRGLRLVRLPTTVLAQNDAGIGVKNGMNLHGGKNTIGTFAPPFAVINDFAFLDTLDDRTWRDGIAEAFKVAIIKDRAFFDRLCADAGKLRARDAAAMEELIRHCARLHLEHIRDSGDPFELGGARPLDFGHWSAHQIECMSGFTIPHGAAVAMGIALDAWYAGRKGWLSAVETEAILAAMRACGLELWHEIMARRLGDGTLALLAGLDSFREHLGGNLTVTYPRGLGSRFEVHEVDAGLIEEGVAFLQSLCDPASARS